jgi:hypothetical protein
MVPLKLTTHRQFDAKNALPVAVCFRVTESKLLWAVTVLLPFTNISKPEFCAYAAMGGMLVKWQKGKYVSWFSSLLIQRHYIRPKIF